MISLFSICAASEQKQLLLSLLPDAPPKDTAMEIDDSSNPAQAKPSSTPKPTTITPEADIFTTLLVIVFLLDQKMIEAVSQLRSYWPLNIPYRNPF